MDRNAAKLLQREFRTEELTEALDDASVGVILAASDGTVLHMNRSAETILGEGSEAAEPHRSLARCLAGLEVWNASASPRSFWARLQESRRLDEQWSLVDGRLIRATGRVSDGGSGWVVALSDYSREHRLRERAKQANKAALVALADLAEYRDHDTGEHILRVARLSYEIARDLRASGHFLDLISDRMLGHIGLASVLHDVGKVTLPDRILLKPGPLTEEERSIMQTHTLKGGEVLEKARAMMVDSEHFRLAAEIAETHHERWDGKGYPHGLAGEEIPLASRIVAVADVYDALVSKRPYKVAWAPSVALETIRGNAGTQFDARIVAALERVCSMRETATVVKWEDSMSVGIVEIDHDHRILLALINQMALPENRNDPIVAEFVIDELVNYTLTHFRREERLLAQRGYENLDRHKQIHDRLIQEVREFQHRVAHRFTPSVGDEISSYLGRWLTRHIMQEDRRALAEPPPKN